MGNSVSILFAGDFCSKPSTSLIKVSDGIKELLDTCEIKVVNFEVPLKPEVSAINSGREQFFQNDDAPDFLKSLGFNLFSIANNHMFDWGNEGFRKTKSALGESAFGAGTYDEAYEVKVVEQSGLRIGFMAVSFAAYKGVFDDVDNHDGLGCAYINDLKVNHVIVEAKKQLDYLFILPHDGIEYIDVPLPETIARYRDFIDYGADGVIAGHPHCPQGWEEYKGRPIFYSLGNFFFNSKEDTLYRAWNRPHWYEGRCVRMTLTTDGIKWSVINTKNIDNVAIEIDDAEASDMHNAQLLNYINDKEAYHSYLNPYLVKQYQSDLLKFDTTFHPQFLRQSIKALCRQILDKLLGRRRNTVDELVYMLKNDLRRTRFLRAAKSVK